MSGLRSEAASEAPRKYPKRYDFTVLEPEVRLSGNRNRRPCCSAAQSSGSTGCFWVIWQRDESKITGSGRVRSRKRVGIMAVRKSALLLLTGLMLGGCM